MSSPARRIPAATTFASALAGPLRSAPSRPLVTFYDDATGERVELSVTTYANWVAKTAGLAQDELDLTRGELLLLDLPTHWLGAVWVGAALTLGLTVTEDRAAVDEAALVVCGPDGLEAYAAHAAQAPVLACALTPLAGRFAEPLPPHVTDFAAVVLAQPDAFAAYDPPGPADPAWSAPSGTTSQGELLQEAAGCGVVGAGGRLLTDVNPATRAGVATLLAPLVLDASSVWVRHPDEASWSGRAEQELATEQLRA